MNNYWSWDGSLTTPPCTEGVKWTMLQQAVPISPAHLAGFAARYQENSNFAPCDEGACTRGNNRNVTPLGDRPLYYNSGAMALTSALAVSLTAALLN